MPSRAYDYVVVRVVPRVHREEFVNVGVIVCCPTADYLECRIRLDPRRVRALCPSANIDAIARHLDGLGAVSAGDPSAGPVAALALRERFHWLVHPRSTVLQTSPVHAGTTVDLDATLHMLLALAVA